MCERGGCDSNCLLQFNLLMLESLRVGKKVTGDKTADDMNCDFGFIIYLEDENGEFQAVTSDQVNREDKMLKLRKASDNSEIPFSEDNSSIFYLKDGEEAVLSGIQKGRKYYVEEVGVDTSRYKVFLNDSEDEETVTDGTVTASQATIAQRPKLTFYNEVRPDRNLRVRKEWIGEGQTNENDEHIGTAVTLHLKADGVEIGSVTLDGNTDEVETTAWEHTFEKLPVEATDSHTIQYTVTEDAVDGYYTLYDTADETTSITVDSTKTYWEAADGMEDPSTLRRGSYLVVAESANSDRALYAEYDVSTLKDGVAHLSSRLTRLSGVLRDEDGIIHNDYLEIPTGDLDNYIWSVDAIGDGYSLYYPTEEKWLGYSTEYYTYNGQQMVSRNSFSLQNSAPSAPILGSDGYLKGSRTSGGSTVTDYIYNNSGAVEVTQNESSATKFTLYRKIIPAETETTTVVTVSNKRVTTLQENQFYLPISKKIDAFRDGDDNPTTTYEDEMTEDEKKDLYRLYLDIGPIQNEKTNVILVMDYSYTMYPVVDEHNDFAYKIGDKYFDRRYLMTDEGGNYVTRYDAMLDAMTGDNSLVDMILPDGNTKNEMYVIGFSEKDKTESLTDWTTDGSDVKSGLAGKIPEGYRNYEAALQEAEEAINNAPADGKTYLIFVSDGIPTAYIKDEIIYEEVGRTYTINSQEYNGKGEESVQNLSGDVDGDGNIIPDSTNSVISHTESVINSFKQAISDKVESVSAVAFSNLDMAQNITAENKAKWDDIRHDYSRITLDTSYDYLLRNVMGDAFYSATGANELVKAVSETLSIRRIQGPVITDQLTGYVSVEGTNNGDLKMIMKYPDPSDLSKTKESVLWENGATTTFNVQSDGTTPIVQNVEVSDTGEIVVTFASNYVLPDDYTFTVSFNVKATEAARNTWITNETASRNEEIAEDERPENGYDGVKGDADTDFSYIDTNGDTHANDTSSDHYGFRSNVSADVVYKVIRDYYREEYKHPVIQVDTTVDITMIKTSSVELPKADGTKGYVILPGVEFTLYEKTVTTETDPDTEEQVEKEVLTPVKTGIVSDDGKADDPNDPDAVAEAAARKGKVFLTDLKRGSTYYLEETKAAEGYFIPAEKWKIVVGIDGTVTISGQDNYAADYTVPESGEFAGCYRISNVKMYELPSTGGPGDYLFTIIGVAICALVVFKRREERAA